MRRPFPCGPKMLNTPVWSKDAVFSDTNLPPTQRYQRDCTPRGGHPAQVQLPLLRCPSYAGQDIATAPEYQRGVGNVAVGNYVGIPGTHIKSDGTLEENGVLVSKWSQRGGGGRGLRIHDISDGTAKTFLLCESREQRYSSWYDGQATWVTALRTDVDETDFLKGRGGFDGDFPKAPPDAAALNVGPGDYTLEGYFPADRYPGQQAREWGPSSNHGGVVIHGFVDGHAKTISVDVGPTTYMRFVTRAAGDPADAFQLE